MKFSFKEDSKRIIVVCLSALLMAVNVKTFVNTGGLYPGGASGLTILIQHCCTEFFNFSIPYTLVSVALNLFPIYIGFRFIGKKFTLYSCFCIFLMGIFIDIIPGYIITYDTLLISIFGGLINGVCVSMCLLMNATTGGTDFISIYYSQKTGKDSWNLVLAINVVILSAAGLLFGWDKALYSIIFQFTATQVLHVLYKNFQQNTLFIVTNHPKEICEAISKISHHGATIMDAIGSYGGENRSVVYSVISSSEMQKVVHTAKEIDPKSFINVLKTEQIAGRFYQKPTD